MEVLEGEVEGEGGFVFAEELLDEGEVFGGDGDDFGLRQGQSAGEVALGVGAGVDAKAADGGFESRFAGEPPGGGAAGRGVVDGFAGDAELPVSADDGLSRAAVRAAST